MSTLAIQVDELVLEKFKSASPQEQLRLEELFNLWWKVYLTEEPKQKLSLVIDHFRQKAEERGLTQEEFNQTQEYTQ